MYSWNIEKKLFFSEKAFVIIISGWLIRIKHYIGVFVLAFPFSFYYSMILMTSLTFFSHKHCTLPTTPEMSKMMTDFCIFLCTNLLKMSCEKRWKWHSWDPKFKNFLGEHAPRPPLARLRWFGLLPHVHTPSKSHTTALKTTCLPRLCHRSFWFCW